MFAGSSTACILILNRETSTVYTANIGDSGFMVVRRGEIVHRSEEQQHYFNTPFQLSLPPPGHGDNVLSDRPESADQLSFPVLDGDVILVATDGLFDNVPTNLLLNTLTEVSDCGAFDDIVDANISSFNIVRRRTGRGQAANDGQRHCADGPIVVVRQRIHVAVLGECTPQQYPHYW